MSIKDWGTVEKIQNLKKVLVLSNICWFRKKKLRGIFGKTFGKFWNSLRKFLRNLGQLWIKFVWILQKTYSNFIVAFQKIVEVFDNLMIFR